MRAATRGLWEQPKPLTSSWTPVDLGPALDGEGGAEPPSVLTRSDGHCLLYPGKVHVFQGEPESGKTWLALIAAVEQLAAGHRVVYIDFDENTAPAIVERLRALGAEPDAIRARFLYLQPDEPLSEDTRADLDRHTQSPPPTLAVIDGVTDGMGLHGLDLANNADVSKWRALLARPLARLGAAVVELDHVTKAREERGRYAIGAQQKLAGVHVALSLHTVEPFGRGQEGVVRVTVAKDRDGHLRQHAEEGRLAELRLLSDGATVTAELVPGSEARAFRPTKLMERVSRELEENPGLSKNAIRRNVTGKNDAIDIALDVLLREDYLSRRRDGQTMRHESVKPYREDDDADNRAPVPHRAPTVPRTRPGHPVPPGYAPVGGTPGRGTVPATENSSTVPLGRDAPRCSCYRPAELDLDGTCSRCHGRPA
jgi:AAA domain